MPEKVYLNVNNVYKETEKLIEKMNIEEQVIIRIYLTTIRNFKQYIFQNIDNNLKNILLRIETPRFIWIADIYSTQRKIQAKIIFDATAGEYENEKWICVINKNKLLVRDSENNISEYKVEKFNFTEFNYNLKEIR